MGTPKNSFSAKTAIKLSNPVIPVNSGIQDIRGKKNFRFHRKERLAALFSLPHKASAFMPVTVYRGWLRPARQVLGNRDIDGLGKGRHSGEPRIGSGAGSGVQESSNDLKELDSGFRRNDGKMAFRTFYETLNIR
jgi:hypothetical protein